VIHSEAFFPSLDNFQVKSGVSHGFKFRNIIKLADL